MGREYLSTSESAAIRYVSNKNRDRTVGIRAGGPMDRSSISGRHKIFLFSMLSIPPLEPTQPTMEWVPGVKRPGRQADHSLPTSAAV
jgi:hypothetical protein